MFKKLRGSGHDVAVRMISDNCVMQSGGVFTLLKITMRGPAKVMHLSYEGTLAQHLKMA